MDQTSDENLFDAFRNGDLQAFDQLVDRHAAGLLGYLRGRTQNPADADDLFQETFRNVIQKADSFQCERRFKPWLYAIARNLGIDGVRRRSRGPQFLTASAVLDRSASSQPTPRANLELAERKKEVHRIVSQLPPRQQETLRLVYFQSMTYAEVAEVMDCAVGTVKTQMSRALQTLARKLPEPSAGGGVHE